MKKIACAGLCTLFLVVGCSSTTTPTIAVSISPRSATVSTGATLQFTATVTGTTNTAVTWSVQEAVGGTVSSGAYTAPASAGTFHVVAVSVADTAKSDVATVTVTTGSVVSVSISPKTATVMVGALQSFTATVTGTVNTAVTWSVQEPNGGTVTGGTYTAPSTAGTFHVVATSDADTNKSDVATVTVTTAPVISVSIDPTTVSMLTGGAQSFTATVSGSTNTAVTWAVEPSTGGGSVAPTGNTAVYTAPGSAGTYQITATSAADTTKSATATATVTLPAAPALSGNVAYVGAKTGRIYLALQMGGGGPGTSLATAGAFNIRGIQGNGYSVTIVAFMDVLGSGGYSYAADPVGQTTVALTGADITGLGITLTDPPSPTTPAQVDPPDIVIPAADSVVVGLKPLTDAQGRELATGYKLYWSTSPNPGPSNKAEGAPKTMPAGGMGLVYLGSPAVTASSAYYFSVAALNGALEGPVSAQVGPVTVAAESGGTTVSGHVAFPGLTVSGPFIVGIYSNSVGAYYTRVTGTTSPQVFSIPGVLPGDYQVFSLIDANNDGFVGFGDPQAGFSDTSVAVAVGSNPVTGVDFALPASDSTARVETAHGKDWSNGGDQYSLGLGVTSNLKRPVAVVLTSGPNVNAPVDVGLDLNRGGGGVQYRVQWDIGSLVPAVGQTYAFDVTYSDGSSGVVSGAVSGVIANRPTALSPSGSIASTTPTLTWTLPGSLPSPYSLHVNLGGNTGWWDYELPPGTTSVLYNVDGRGGPLSSGGSYNWGIDVLDQFGNRASDQQQFNIQ